MILIVSTCKEKIHEMEFVRPVEQILNKNNVKFKTIHYSKLKISDINESDKIIITGTSLEDNEFLKNINCFSWIKSINKPILGICAGMQVISLIYNGKPKDKKEIGYYKENFTRGFLKLIGEQEVYHLHNNYITLPKEFDSFTDTKIPQAIKHKEKPIYGVLFHPEVRNEKLIENFIQL
jgi:GMP synthase-like glutamine amidotransferase